MSLGKPALASWPLEDDKSADDAEKEVEQGKERKQKGKKRKKPQQMKKKMKKQQNKQKIGEIKKGKAGKKQQSGKSKGRKKTDFPGGPSPVCFPLFFSFSLLLKKIIIIWLHRIFVATQMIFNCSM